MKNFVITLLLLIFSISLFSQQRNINNELLVACGKGNYKAVKNLILCGANVNARKKRGSNTALMQTVLSRNI